MAATVRRWNGVTFVVGGVLRRWDGAGWRPRPNGIVASGGVISNGGGYRLHTFTAPGSLQITAGAGSVEIFLVGGGGAGSSGTGGGGGGGGVVTALNIPVAVGGYIISVGNGGAISPDFVAVGDNGANSSAFGFTAFGGGFGACTTPTGSIAAGAGGSGGGGAEYSGRFGAPGATLDGLQGFSATFTHVSQDGGGGGGAGAGGTNPIDSRNGGPGIANSWATGSPSFYGGGGGGSNNGLNGAAGTDGTGGGGGGGWNYSDGRGGKGGTGLILVRYVL